MVRYLQNFPTNGERYMTERLRRAQDAVLSNYKTRFKLTQKEVDDLHMFFSPTRIPKGLRLKEVRIILLLFTLRDSHRKQQFKTELPHPTLISTLRKISLPTELMPKGKMTRSGFKTGIYKMLEQIASATS